MRSQLDFTVVLKSCDDDEYDTVVREIESKILEVAEVESVDIGIGEELGDE